MLTRRHRLRHRAGARRPFAALLAAVAVVATSVLFLSTPPASADPFPPALEAEVDEAVSDAKFALLRPECNALLSGVQSTGFVSARDVLNTIPDPVFQPVPPPPLPADTYASAPVGAGLRGIIHIHQVFDEIETRGNFYSGSPAMSTTDVGVNRAVVILHEVGHLTGVERAHEARTDALGRPVSAVEEVGLYNTRILNTCFAPRVAYRIGQASCRQTFEVDLGVVFSTIACDAVCRPDAGPVVVAWTSSLQSTITTDTITDDNGSTFCHSTRVSNCPVPTESGTAPGGGIVGVFPPTDITLTITDAFGHVSQDTMRVTCDDPNPNYGGGEGGPYGW